MYNNYLMFQGYHWEMEIKLSVTERLCRTRGADCISRISIGCGSSYYAWSISKIGEGSRIRSSRRTSIGRKGMLWVFIIQIS